jgi:ankyrin repeat protein
MPLHTAAERNCLVNAVLLVGASADVNAQNEDGNATLHIAAENGRLKMVQLLDNRESARSHSAIARVY